MSSVIRTAWRPNPDAKPESCRRSNAGVNTDPNLWACPRGSLQLSSQSLHSPECPAGRSGEKSPSYSAIAASTTRFSLYVPEALVPKSSAVRQRRALQELLHQGRRRYSPSVERGGIGFEKAED